MTTSAQVFDLEAYAAEVIESHQDEAIQVALLQVAQLPYQELGELPPTHADHQKLVSDKIGAALMMRVEVLNGGPAAAKVAIRAYDDLCQRIGDQLVAWASAKTRREAEDALDQARTDREVEA